MRSASQKAGGPRVFSNRRALQGGLTLAQALAQSCNTAFITERDELGGTELFDAAASLGLGLDQDLGFPAYFGSVRFTTSLS